MISLSGQRVIIPAHATSKDDKEHYGVMSLKTKNSKHEIYVWNEQSKSYIDGEYFTASQFRIIKGKPLVGIDVEGAAAAEAAAAAKKTSAAKKTPVKNAKNATTAKPTSPRRTPGKTVNGGVARRTRASSILSEKPTSPKRTPLKIALGTVAGRTAQPVKVV